MTLPSHRTRHYACVSVWAKDKLQTRELIPGLGQQYVLHHLLLNAGHRSIAISTVLTTDPRDSIFFFSSLLV